MRLVTSSGQSIALGKALGEGGEGRVVAWTQGRCVKLSRTPPDSTLVRKLQALIARGPGRLQGQAAWPLELVHDADTRRVLGYVMTQVPGVLSHQIFNAAERRLERPDLGYRFLVHAASNLASAISDAHADGLVIGDLNSEGVLIDHDARVHLIDIDSVQLRQGSAIYRCMVARPEYLAPEWHGRDFATLDRDVSSDGFAVAVLIFQLLCMGRHPYIGAFQGSGEMPDPDAAIATTGYAYGRNRRRFGWDRVPGWPHPEMIAPDLASLFEAAFAPVQAGLRRPLAAEWAKALRTYEQGLVACGANSLHAHSRGAPCPWCGLQQQGKAFFTPVVSAGDAAALSPEAVAQSIEAIRAPVARRLAVLRAHGTSAEPYGVGRFGGMLAAPMVLCGIVGGFFGCAALQQRHSRSDTPGIVCGLGLAAMVLLFLVRLGLRRLADSQRDAAQRQLEAIGGGPETLVQCLRAWEDTEQALREMPKRKLATVTTLSQRHYESALRDHLSRYLIARQRIGDIGPSLIGTLAAYGISTAADIVSERVRTIRGFGPKRSSALLAWRKSCEASFRYQADVRAIEAQAVAATQQEILSLLQRLRQAAQALQVEDDEGVLRRLRLANRRARWEATRKALG